MIEWLGWIKAIYGFGLDQGKYYSHVRSSIVVIFSGWMDEPVELYM